MSEVAQYRICPRCSRAVPVHAKEQFCINDGVLLLEKCPKCQTKIYSPYTRHCAKCGFAFEQVLTGSVTETSQIQTRGKARSARSRFVLLIGVVGALLVTWLFRPKQELNMVFVGKIPQSQAFIAIAFQQKRVLAYVCDGQKIAEWFKGSVTDQNTLELKSKNGAVLVATLDAQSVQGSIELPVGNWAFAAIPARDQAAFYRAERNGKHKTVAGWIVLANGEQHGAIVAQTGVRVAPKLEKPSDLMKIASFGLIPKMVNTRNPNGFQF